MEDPSCLKDMEVPPCTGEGGEASEMSSIPGKQLWYGVETSSGGPWKMAVVGSGEQLGGPWKTALESSSGKHF